MVQKVAQEIQRVAPGNKQQERALAIIEAATTVFSRDGYSSFTMRRIAHEAGMQLKSLQRIFPTKQLLLNAMIDHVLYDYYDRNLVPLVEVIEKATPEERLMAFVDYLLQALREQFTTLFFPELWSLAGRSEGTARAMDMLYEKHIGSLTEMVREVNPVLSVRKAKQRAAIIAMSIEGLILILGNDKPSHEEYKDLDEEVKLRIMGIIHAPV